MQKSEFKSINQNLLTKIMVLLIFLINLGLFGQSLYFDFFVLDDGLHLHEKIDFLKLNIHNVKYFWINTKMPVVYNVWQIIYTLFGLESAFAYRLFNILLHSINAVLIFDISRRIITYSFKNLSSERIIFASFILSTLFSIHPSQIESVIWISSLKGILSATFILLSIRFFISNSYSLFFVILFFILSALAKPTSISLIFLYPFLNIIFKKYKNKNFLFSFSLILIPLALLSIRYLESETDQTLEKIYSILTIKDISLLFIQANLEFFMKIIFPFKYSIDYGLSLQKILIKSFTAPTTNFLIFIISISFFVYILKKIFQSNIFATIAFAILIYLLTISFYTGLIPFSFSMNSLIADRYLYLPIIGLSLFFVVPILANFSNRFFYNAYFLILVSTFIFSYGSINKWRSNEVILKASALYNPQSTLINMALGKVLMTNDKYNEAEFYLKKVIEYNPENLESRINLFHLYVKSPNLKASKENYRQIIKLIKIEDPRISHLYYTSLHAAKAYQDAYDFIKLQNEKFPDVLQIEEDLTQIIEACKSGLAPCILRD